LVDTQDEGPAIEMGVRCHPPSTVLPAGVQGWSRRADPHHRQDGRPGRPRAGPDRDRGAAVKRADLDAGRRSDGLTTAEHAELRRLRREVRSLRKEALRLPALERAAFLSSEVSGPGPRYLR